MTHTIRMRVNGKDYTVDVPSQRLLIDCLRYDLGLTGTKEGCSVGVCGACTVVMDGVLVSSCLTLTVLADGKEITTVKISSTDKVRFKPLTVNIKDVQKLKIIVKADGLFDISRHLDLADAKVSK